MQVLTQAGRLGLQPRGDGRTPLAIRAVTLALVCLFAVPTASHGEPAGRIETRSLIGAVLYNYLSTEGRELEGDQDHPGKLTVFRREALLVNPASCKTCAADVQNFITYYEQWRAKKWHDNSDPTVPFVHVVLGSDEDRVETMEGYREFSVKLRPGREDLATELVNLGIGLRKPCIVQTFGVVFEVVAAVEYVTCAPTFKQAWEAQKLPAGPVMLARIAGQTFEPRRGRTQTLRQVAEGWRENDLFFNRDDAPDRVTISPSFAASLRAAYQSDREYRIVAKFAPPPNDFIIDGIYPSNEGSTDTCYNLATRPEACVDEALDIHTHPLGAADAFSPADVSFSSSQAKPVLMVNEKGVYLALPTDRFVHLSPFLGLQPVNSTLSDVLDITNAENELSNEDKIQVEVGALADRLGSILYRLKGTTFEKIPTTTLSSSFQTAILSFDKLTEVQKEWILLLVAVHNAHYDVQDWDVWLSDPKTIQSAMATTALVVEGPARTEIPLDNLNMESLYELAVSEGLIFFNDPDVIQLPSRGNAGEHEMLYSQHIGKSGHVYEMWFRGLVETGFRTLATANDCDYLGSKVCDYVSSVGARQEVRPSR